MKTGNEIWVIKADASIVQKMKNAETYEWLVIYTVAEGFQTLLSTATIVSLGDDGHNLHLSCSIEPETTFPEMLASFYDENDDKILSGLKHYGFDISNSGVRKHILKAVKYAWKHEDEFEKEEIVWTKI